MNDYAVQVKNISKQYHIGTIQSKYRTIRETMVDVFKAPIRRAARLMRGQAHGAAELDQTFWALKNISFNVSPGEVVGIIGRNGAGKSTLLKILSRITDPSEGEADIYGRVGSLLEVGTGFHPELTGRENIFLNGAILGMRRAEITQKFDEIVDFSEVEKFIDTPVKHYSSGMYVRLAFAVAAHLEPEILLIDEVLAVGDAEFQKKCLGAMKDMSGAGRTVLFVSHNMSAVENLCQRVIWLDNGKIEAIGLPREIISRYLTEDLSDDAIINLESFEDRSGRGDLRITQVELLNGNGQPTAAIQMGEALTIRFTVQRMKDTYQGRVTLGSHLHTVDGILVSDFRTNHAGFDPGAIAQVAKFDLVIDQVLLYPRTYVLSPWVSDSFVKDDMDWLRYAVKFTVEPSDLLGTGAHFSSDFGMTHIHSSWQKVV